MPRRRPSFDGFGREETWVGEVRGENPGRIMTPVGSDESAAPGWVFRVQGEPRLVYRDVVMEPAERRQISRVMISILCPMPDVMYL